MNRLATRNFVFALAFALALGANFLYRQRTGLMPIPEVAAIELPREMPPPRVFEDDPRDLAAVRDFAERYQPRSGVIIIPDLPVPDARAADALGRLASAGSRAHEKYIVLIGLRLYRFHIENSHQSYDLDRDGLVARELFRLTGAKNWRKAEFVSSALAADYVEEHPELLNYAPIRAEMKRIAF